MGKYSTSTPPDSPERQDGLPPPPYLPLDLAALTAVTVLATWTALTALTTSLPNNPYVCLWGGVVDGEEALPGLSGLLEAREGCLVGKGAYQPSRAVTAFRGEGCLDGKGAHQPY